MLQDFSYNNQIPSSCFHFLLYALLVCHSSPQLFSFIYKKLYKKYLIFVLFLGRFIRQIFSWFSYFSCNMFGRSSGGFQRAFNIRCMLFISHISEQTPALKNLSFCEKILLLTHIEEIRSVGKYDRNVEEFVRLCKENLGICVPGNPDTDWGKIRGFTSLTGTSLHIAHKGNLFEPTLNRAKGITFVFYI